MKTPHVPLCDFLFYGSYMLLMNNELIFLIRLLSFAFLRGNRGNPPKVRFLSPQKAVYGDCRYKFLRRGEEEIALLLQKCVAFILLIFCDTYPWVGQEAGLFSKPARPAFRCESMS